MKVFNNYTSNVHSFEINTSWQFTEVITFIEVIDL